MKNLTLLIHEDLKADVADLLRSMERVPGFALSEVEGHGRQSQDDARFSARDKVVGYVPRVRIEILLEEKDVAEVLAEIRKSSIGLKGHAVYQITQISEFGRL